MKNRFWYPSKWRLEKECKKTSKHNGTCRNINFSSGKWSDNSREITEHIGKWSKHDRAHRKTIGNKGKYTETNGNNANQRKRTWTNGSERKRQQANGNRTETHENVRKRTDSENLFSMCLQNPRNVGISNPPDSKDRFVQQNIEFQTRRIYSSTICCHNQVQTNWTRSG